MAKKKRYELKKKDFMKSSVFATAFVTHPAIEVGLVYLNAEKQPSYKLKLEKGIAYSPVLIPDQIIPRSTEGGEEFEVYFTTETIEELSQDYMMSGANVMQNWNSQHNDNQKLEGVAVVENWIVEDPETDKATKLGFKVPKGTWMQGIKVDNEAVKSKIKDGEYFGISIEGDFDHIALSKQTVSTTKIFEEMADSIVTKLKKELGIKTTKLGSQTLESGEMIYFEGEELIEGMTVYSDEAMTIQVGKYIDGKVEMDKPAEEEFDAEEKVKEVAEVAIENNESIEALKAENTELKKSLEEFKTKFEAIENKIGEHETKLSKVKVGESTTKLKAEPGKSSAYQTLKSKIK